MTIRDLKLHQGSPSVSLPPMHCVDPTKLPASSSLAFIYRVDGLWMAHCSANYYYLGTDDVVYGVAELLGGRLRGYVLNNAIEQRRFTSLLDYANADDELMLSLLLDRQAREKEPHANFDDGRNPTPSMGKGDR